MSGPDGFLARWSKRKREAVEPPREAGPEIGERAADVAVPPPAAEAEEPAFDISTLPSIDELTGESDISAFLAKGVPEALKNAALRRIWAADPAIRDHIGPVDYGWDFNAPETIPGFGALEPGFDVEAAARRIAGLAEPETNRNAGPDAAVAEEPEPRRADAHEAAEAPLAAPAGEAVEPAESAAELPPAVPRRRHGGALPSL